MTLLRNKKILIISPEPWSHVFVSKHHYAVHLARRKNKVFFLNPPGKILGLSKTEFEDVNVIDYTGFISGLRFFPRLVQQRMMRNVWGRLEEMAGQSFDINWSFDNSVFYDFSFLPNSVLKICHIVDLNQNFQRRLAATTADCCLCSSDFILAELSKWNKRTFKINHGYNQSDDHQEVTALPGENKLKAFYGGNLDISYLDWALAETIIRDNPDVDFLFAGSMKKKQSVFELNNVYYLGVLASDSLGAYMCSCDINIIIYKADQYEKQLANPHKGMQYLGSGKMIVTTYTHEFRHLVEKKYILMSGANDEYPQLFQQALEELDYWNSVDMIRNRKEFALENTYENQIEKIEKVLLNL